MSDFAPCQLYVVTGTHAGAIQQLAAVLHAVRVAAVLVRTVGTVDVVIAKSLVELAQSRNIAALIEADMQLARTLRADGVHLPPGQDLVQRFETAREILGTSGMIGVDPGASRHEAMELAELGADYVAFGPAEPNAELDQASLLQWWSEIFQVPCVATDVATADDAGRYARMGVDFVTVALPGDSTPAECAALAKTYAQAIDVAPAV